MQHLKGHVQYYMSYSVRLSDCTEGQRHHCSCSHLLVAVTDSKSISSCTDPGLQVSASGLIPLQHNKTWATEWFATEAGMQPSDTSSSAQISADISARWGQQQSHCTHGSQHALSHDSRAFGLQQIRSARPGSGGSPTSRSEVTCFASCRARALTAQ